MVTGIFLRGSDDLTRVQAIRTEVFVREQGFPAETEADSTDARAVHALLLNENERPIATGRLYIDEQGYWHIGRLCVLAEERGKQYGDLVMRMLLDKALRAGAKHFHLSAQTDKVGFYKRYGFWETGERYFEKDKPHSMMEADDASIEKAAFTHCD